MLSGLIRKAQDVAIGLVALSFLFSLTPLTGYAQRLDDTETTQNRRNQRQERPRFGKQSGKNGQDREAKRQKMMEQFGLTPEQMEEFKSIREASKTEANALKSEIRQKRQAMMTYMQSADANERQALSMNREMSDLMARVGALRIKTLFQMKGVMTPEQYEKFVAQRKQMHQRMKGRQGQQSRRGGFKGQSGQGQDGFRRNQGGGRF